MLSPTAETTVGRAVLAMVIDGGTGVAGDVDGVGARRSSGRPGGVPEAVAVLLIEPRLRSLG